MLLSDLNCYVKCFLQNFFLPDGSSDEEKEKPKRQKESLKKRAKKRKREAEEQRLEVDQVKFICIWWVVHKGRPLGWGLIQIRKTAE